jgi:hypothetical protein
MFLFLILLGLTMSLGSNLVPEHSKMVNLGLLMGILAAGAGVLGLWGRKKFIRLTLLLAFAAALLPFALPGRPLDAVSLRQDYVKRMTSFEGTPYFWGGESRRGIDCSGLPRRALRDALLAQGLRTGNGRAFRSAFENWWYDASALALSSGFREYARPLPGGGKIQELETSGLLPGDFAVTANKTHLLAYAGDGKWIQADPGLNIVITLHGQKDRNSWFQTEVSLHRWTLLE